MNVLKKLIGGGGGKKKGSGKKDGEHNSDYDYEGEHVQTDFDKTFEDARRASSVVPQIIRECDYRGSPSRANRSKSPSPYQQTQQQQQQKPLLPKKVSTVAGGTHTPTCARKGSAPEACSRKPADRKSVGLEPKIPDKELMKRKMTESQQKRAKEIVESLDWIKPTEVCYTASAQPLVVKAETIQPQMHVCEMISMPKANQQLAVAIIPQNKQLALHHQPLAATGKLRVPGGQR